MSEVLDALRAILPALPEVSRIGPLRRFSSLCAQGQTATALYVIERGMVKLTRTDENGERVILAVAGPGDFFGEEAMHSEPRAYHTDAETITSVTLYRIPRETLGKLFSASDQMARQLIDLLVNRRLAFAEKIELLCLKDVESRILYHLARLADCLPESESAPGRQVPLTQAELAELIGATRETTSTLLNQLERRGLIQLARRLLTVPSPGVLRTASNGAKQIQVTN